MVCCWYLHSFTSLHHFIVFYCFCDWAPSGLLFVGWDSLLMMDVRQPHWLQRWWLKKNSLISRQFLFLFFLISLVPYYDTNQCFWVHWTSIPKFTTPTKKIQFLAFLLWNWMMRLLYSQHISDKIGWPASIQSFLIPLDFSLWNKQFQIETDESKLQNQGMTPLKLEIREGDSDAEVVNYGINQNSNRFGTGSVQRLSTKLYSSAVWFICSFAVKC